MKFRLTRAAAGVLGVLGILVLMMGPETVQAKLSASTGKINGSAPTATGSLLVRAPNGTVVPNNFEVAKTWVPNNFTVSPDTTDLVLSDLDGDCDVRPSIALCTATVNTAAATLVWKYNGTALTGTQLAAPFGQAYAGKNLTVVASAPVTVTSTTGAPTSTTISLTSSTIYTFKVPLPPVIRVNGASFALSTSFPSTGFTGATFQYYMNGVDATSNSRYRFSLDQSAQWLSVTPTTGVVTFTSQPVSRSPVVVRITDTLGDPDTVHTIDPRTWFVTSGNSGSINAARAECSALGGGWRVPAIAEYVNNTTNSAATRGNGNQATLWNDWGDLSNTTGIGFLDRSFYWVVGEKGELQNTNISGYWWVFAMVSGAVNSTPNTNYQIVCGRSL